MRAGLPIAVLVAFLALIAGALWWVLREPDRPAAAPGAARGLASAERSVDDSFAPAARAEVAAAARAHDEVPAATPAPEAAGRAAVGGWLRVEGRSPGERIALRLEQLLEDGSRQLDQESSATADGGFRFESVAEGWSGAIVLPDHYRLARPEEHGGKAGAFPARAGQEDLLLEVVRRPLLRGRVLTPERTPLADAYVLVELRRTSSTSTWSARAGADGRFARALPADAPLRITVTCRSDEGGTLQRSWEAESLPAPDARGDIDVGDLQLVAADRAWVRVLDPEGEPFEGASVSEIATTGTRTVKTGPDGRAAVVLPPNLLGFEVVAEGYRLVELPRPAPGTEIVAHLVPTHVLTVEVLDTGGEAWPHGRLRLRTPRFAFEGGHAEPNTPLPGEQRQHSFEWGQDREGTYALFRPDPKGRVVWPGLVLGQDLELTLEDALGTFADHQRVPGLAPGERRTVRLQLSREPRRVTGRCVDARGDAIADAELNFSVARAGSTDVRSREDGTFASPPLLAERLRLRASAPGFADRSIEDVALPAELTVVLRRGRALHVFLRDAHGSPFPSGRVQAGIDGTHWTASTSVPGHHELRDVPDVGLELEHTWHGRTHRAVVPDGVESFEWELPATGRLEVEVAAFPLGEQEAANLVLEALDGRGGVEQRLLQLGEPWNNRFDAWPGRYRLRCVVHTYTVDADGWRDFAGDRTVGEPVEVEVALGRITQAVLETAE